MKSLITQKKEFYWRKLDDQAKVFALASNSKYSSVFRLSIILKEKVDKEILQQALESTLKTYKAFNVRMRKGLFWYYFDENDKKPIVKIENEYPFGKVNTRENNNFLFKVTYFRNKINIEFFHALTDGTNGIEFFKQIVYKYLEIKRPNDFKENLKIEKVFKDSENAYKKNYDKNAKKKETVSRAYMLKGEEFQNNEVCINHFNINLEEMKKNSKSKECTLSMYIIGMIAYSIYESNYKVNNGKRPINICVPINLKKYFDTDTISNFFSYMIINLKLKNNKVYTFEDILEMVKKEFDKKLKIERILETMSSDGGMTNNIFVRIVPLILKKAFVRIGSLQVKRHFTMTISNIGKIEIDDEYKKYIENCLVILSPDWAEKTKCGICSFENNLVVSFGTKLKENQIEKQFKKLLKEKNIKFKIEGNCLSNVF